jgi:hypothetical protein
MKSILLRTTFTLLFAMLVQVMFAQKWPGYTLITPKTTSAYLWDTSGNVYHTWTLTGSTGYSGYLLPGGYLIRSVTRTGNSFTGGPITGKVQKVSYDGTILWDYVYSTTDYCMHHDIHPMPNGNVLLIAYERKTAAQASAAGSTNSIEMWPDKIVEVKPTGLNTGEVVWEWHAWDHLVQNVDASKANYYASISDHPELLNINYSNSKDWMHVNGVSYNAELDQVTFSSHNLNEIYVIDHSTTTAEAASHAGGKYGKGGDFLYRWGNPAAYGVTGTKVLNVVHDAHWVPNGCPNAGALVGFNNYGVSTTKSSVDLVFAPINDDGSYNKTAGAAFSPSSYSLRHAVNGVTSNEGGSQQLPNGNMIVCVGKAGILYEVDSNGTVLFTKTITGGAAKAQRYSKCYIDSTLAPTPVITIENGTTLTTTSATTYQWYKNGSPISGATSQTYVPTTTAKYQVKVTNASGCESLVSASYKFTSSSNGIENNAALEFDAYPNPTGDYLNLHGDMINQGNIEIALTDINGALVYSGLNQQKIDVSELNNGLYFLTVKTEKGSAVKKIVVFK